MGGNVSHIMCMCVSLFLCFGALFIVVSHATLERLLTANNVQNSELITPCQHGTRGDKIPYSTTLDDLDGSCAMCISSLALAVSLLFNVMNYNVLLRHSPFWQYVKVVDMVFNIRIFVRQIFAGFAGVQLFV